MMDMQAYSASGLMATISKGLGTGGNADDTSDNKIKAALQSSDIEKRKEALSSLITTFYLAEPNSQFTFSEVGESSRQSFDKLEALLPNVVKCLSTPDLQVKRLAHSIMASFSSTHKELALLSINSFQHDIADKNHLVRGYAIKALCSLNLLEATSIMLSAVKLCLSDPSPFVRTLSIKAALKVYALDEELLHDVFYMIVPLLRDGEIVVVSAALYALSVMLTSGKFDELVSRNGEEEEKVYSVLSPFVRRLCNRLTQLEPYAQQACIYMLMRCFLRYRNPYFHILFHTEKEINEENIQNNNNNLVSFCTGKDENGKKLDQHFSFDFKTFLKAIDDVRKYSCSPATVIIATTCRVTLLPSLPIPTLLMKFSQKAEQLDQTHKNIYSEFLKQAIEASGMLREIILETDDDIISPLIRVYHSSCNLLQENIKENSKNFDEINIIHNISVEKQLLILNILLCLSKSHPYLITIKVVKSTLLLSFFDAQAVKHLKIQILNNILLFALKFIALIYKFYNAVSLAIQANLYGTSHIGLLLNSSMEVVKLLPSEYQAYYVWPDNDWVSIFCVKALYQVGYETTKIFHELGGVDNGLAEVQNNKDDRLSEFNPMDNSLNENKVEIETINNAIIILKEASMKTFNVLIDLIRTSESGLASESIVAIRNLLQQQTLYNRASLSNSLSIFKNTQNEQNLHLRDCLSSLICLLASILPKLQASTARVSIIWLLGKYQHKIPFILPDILRNLTLSFSNERPEVKAQVLCLGLRLAAFHYFNAKKNDFINQESVIDSKKTSGFSSKLSQDLQPRLMGLIKYLFELGSKDLSYYIRDISRVYTSLFEFIENNKNSNKILNEEESFIQRYLEISAEHYMSDECDISIKETGKEKTFIEEKLEKKNIIDNDHLSIFDDFCVEQDNYQNKSTYIYANLWGNTKQTNKIALLNKSFASLNFYLTPSIIRGHVDVSLPKCCYSTQCKDLDDAPSTFEDYDDLKSSSGGNLDRCKLTSSSLGGNGDAVVIQDKYSKGISSQSSYSVVLRSVAASAAIPNMPAAKASEWGSIDAFYAATDETIGTGILPGKPHFNNQSKNDDRISHRTGKRDWMEIGTELSKMTDAHTDQNTLKIVVSKDKGTDLLWNSFEQEFHDDLATQTNMKATTTISGSSHGAIPPRTNCPEETEIFTTRCNFSQDRRKKIDDPQGIIIQGEDDDSD